MKHQNKLIASFNIYILWLPHSLNSHKYIYFVNNNNNNERPKVQERLEVQFEIVTLSFDRIKRLRCVLSRGFSLNCEFLTNCCVCVLSEPATCVTNGNGMQQHLSPIKLNKSLKGRSRHIRIGDLPN